MEFARVAFHRIKALFRRRADEDEMQKEMRLHIELIAKEYEQSGMSPEQARLAARRRFGNLVLIQERGRDVRGAGILGDLVQDVRYAARTFRQSPVFCAVIVMSLAVGIGANTAVFSAVNGLFLKTLPVREPETLVRLKHSGPMYIAARTSDWGYSEKDAAGRQLNPQNLLLFQLDPLLNRYDPTRIVLLYDGIARELEALPGVRSVSLSQMRFLSGDTQTTGIRIPGDEKPWSEADRVYLFGVAPNFFETMQIPLIAGRLLTDRDNNQGAPTVAIFNESAARKFFPGEDPVGRRFLWNTLGPNRKILQRDIEIAGVVQDAKHASLRDAAPPMIYLPYLQLGIRGMTFITRTDPDPVTLIPSVREAVRRIDPNLPLIDISTQLEQMETRFAEERFFALSYSLVGALALIVASIGLFGVVSYNVALRTNEMGLRLALGAQRFDVILLVLKESLFLVVIGTALGTAGSHAATRLIESLLFGLDSTDALTFASAAGLMTIVSLLAAYLPARRASRIDPIVALRYD